MILPVERKKESELTGWARNLLPGTTYDERRYWTRSFISEDVSAAIAQGILSQPVLFRYRQP